MQINNNFVMNSIEDANEMLKSATIYRNSESNYIYVCYHCECSFTNIVDTLNHVESHFDAKVNIIDGNVEQSDGIPEIVRGELQFFKADKMTGHNLLAENVNPLLLSDGISSGDLKIECAFVEQKYEYHEEDATTDFNEFTNKDEDPCQLCKLCDQNFDTAPLLIIHIMKQHDHTATTTLTCPQCFQNWTNETEFTRHLQQHIDGNDTTYPALIDRVKTNCEVAVEKTLRGRYLPKTCDICSSSFSSKEKLLSHMKQQHIKPPEVTKVYFDCAKCEQKIEGKFAFYAHQYGHLTNDDRTIIVEDEILQRNLRKFIDDSITSDESTPKTTFGCNICSQSGLKQRSSAQYHILQQHIHSIKKSKDKRFSCEYCGRKFASSSNLVVHRRTHTLEKPYKCLICNKSFSQSTYMRYHEKIHTGMQPMQCPICGRNFRTNSKLNFHIKCHSNETTKCSICSKELKTHRLKLHIRNVHENEHRPYKCTVCLQAFKTAKTLRTHSYRHSGEKKYECRLHCKEMFFSSASRRAHERSKHDAH